MRHPDICGGQPVFQGTRGTLRTGLAARHLPEAIIEQSPTLKPEDI